jgi:catechol 2,3-dioxygenase-like lactoylglutathione lyase family enzyme
VTAPDRLLAFVASSDLDAARDFYGGVLGLQLRDESPHALVASTSGTELWITKVDVVSPAAHTVLGWAVDDIEATVDRRSSSGVTFLRYDGMAQDSRGIWTEPDGDRWAWFSDPDGNNLAYVQRVSSPT